MILKTTEEKLFRNNKIVRIAQTSCACAAGFCDTRNVHCTVSAIQLDSANQGDLGNLADTRTMKA